MKKLFIFLLSLTAFSSAFPQTGNDTTKYIYFKNEYGQKFNRIWGLNVVDIPPDTTFSKYGVARKGLNIYVGNGTQWANVTGTGSVGVNSFNTRTGSVTSVVGDYSSFYFPIAGVHGTAGNILYLGADASAFTTTWKYDSTNGALTETGGPGVKMDIRANVINANGASSALSTMAATGFTSFNGAQLTTVTPTNIYIASTPVVGNGATLYLTSSGTAQGQGALKFKDIALVTTPESGLIEYFHGYAMLTDSISGVDTRDTIATRGFVRSIGGGSGGGAVTSLTTSGTSGAATLITGVLNIPVYAGGLVDPLTTNGDLIARVAGSTTRLPEGANNTVLNISNVGLLNYGLLTNNNLNGSAGISNANMHQMPAHTRLGNVTGSTTTPTDVTSAQETADLNVFTSSTQGVVPASPGNTTSALFADGTWKKALQPSDSTLLFVTQYQFLHATDSINFRTPGTAPGAIVMGYVNGGALVFPKVAPGTGMNFSVAGADSVWTINGYLDPLTTTGDILAKIAGVTSRLAQGANGTFLGVSGGLLGYYAPTSAIQYSTAVAVNTSNYTVTSANAVTLPDLTGQANRNIVLPTSPLSGQILRVKNINTNASGFFWTFTNGTVKDFAQNTVTTLANLSSYDLWYDASITTWNIAN